MICFIDVNVFKEIVDSNKDFAHEFMKDFSKSVLSVYNRLLFLTQKQMPGRMADTLIYLFEGIYESDRFPMHLSRQDLSELSGMSKESGTKILRSFQKDGIILLSDDEMKLLNPLELKRISKIG
jgi:CRP/FNR family transcriptional regulator